MYTRFLVAAHSLDQIIYGISLGLWSGFTMHFLVRDNLMEHIQTIYDFWYSKTRPSAYDYVEFSSLKYALIAISMYIMFFTATLIFEDIDEKYILANGPDV